MAFLTSYSYFIPLPWYNIYIFINKNICLEQHSWKHINWTKICIHFFFLRFMAVLLISKKKKYWNSYSIFKFIHFFFTFYDTVFSISQKKNTEIRFLQYYLGFFLTISQCGILIVGISFFPECLKTLFVSKKLGRLGDDSACIHEVAKIIETASVDVNVDVVLHEACGLDISKFCRDTATGTAQNMLWQKNQTWAISGGLFFRKTRFKCQSSTYTM